MLFTQLFLLVSLLSFGDTNNVAIESYDDQVCQTGIVFTHLEDVHDNRYCSVTKVYRLQLLHASNIQSHTISWSVVNCQSGSCDAFWNFMPGSGPGDISPEIMMWGCGGRTIRVTGKCLNNASLLGERFLSLSPCC